RGEIDKAFVQVFDQAAGLVDRLHHRLEPLQRLVAAGAYSAGPITVDDHAAVHHDLLAQRLDGLLGFLALRLKLDRLVHQLAHVRQQTFGFGKGEAMAHLRDSWTLRCRTPAPTWSGCAVRRTRPG